MKVFGFSGWSGAGKTTLIERLIPEFAARGLRVSVIKQAHKEFDLDQPGKDSYRHRRAGAREVLLSGGQRWALIHEFGQEPEPELEDCLRHLAPCDLVLVEGFKNEAIPKIEIHRPALGKPLLAPNHSHIIAVATDSPLSTALRCLSLDDPVAVADFVLATLG
jgi:molybdopterin-guanine dinucleotide biosynthesis protein B